MVLSRAAGDRGRPVPERHRCGGGNGTDPNVARRSAATNPGRPRERIISKALDNNVRVMPILVISVLVGSTKNDDGYYACATDRVCGSCCCGDGAS